MAMANAPIHAFMDFFNNILSQPPAALPLKKKKKKKKKTSILKVLHGHTKSPSNCMYSWRYLTIL